MMPGTSMQNALSALRPIHAPPSVSWWPPAPGWWLLAFLLLGLIVFLVWLYLAGRVMRQALRELSMLENRRGLSDREFAVGISLILRRYVIACFGYKDAVALAGVKWLRFLQEHAPAGVDFLNGPARVLGGDIYSEGCSVDREGLVSAARIWIRKNRCGVSFFNILKASGRKTG